MNLYISTYDVETGRFTNILDIPADLKDIQHPHIEGVFDDQTAYVDLSVSPPEQRWKTTHVYGVDKLSIAASGEDFATVYGLPPYTVVTWPDGESEVVMDEVAKFCTDLPGVYQIRLDAVPFLSAVVEIVAT